MNKIKFLTGIFLLFSTLTFAQTQSHNYFVTYAHTKGMSDATIAFDNKISTANDIKYVEKVISDNRKGLEGITVWNIEKLPIEKDSTNSDMIFVTYFGPKGMGNIVIEYRGMLENARDLLMLSDILKTELEINQITLVAIKRLPL